MKKILLAFAIVSLLICALAISVSAAPQSYASFEAIVDGERVTVYTVGLPDLGNGKLNVSDVAYVEPPVDSEGTYALLDWSVVSELDFTNTALFSYDSKKSEHIEYEGGTNSNANGNVTLKKAWSDVSVFNSVKKVITGNAFSFEGAVFEGWSGLETVVFSPALKTISDNLLRNSSVANLVFSEDGNLDRCANNPFANCDNLVNVDFPDTITYLGNSGLFNGCDNLESVDWPSNCPAIPGGAFSGCTKLVFEIPSFITEIKSSAFQGCLSITSVVIPKSVTAIGSDCFRNCSNLTSVVFEEGCSVSDIYAHTFNGCAFSEITLPNTVKQMKESVFSNNANLRVINLGASFVDFNLQNNAASNMNCGNGLAVVYLSKNFTSAGVRRSIFGGDYKSNEHPKCVPNLVIYYEGDKAAAEAIVAAGALEQSDGHIVNGVFANMTLVTLAEYEALEAANALSGRYMIYDYNKCDAFYGGVHAEGEVINSCQFGCGRKCGKAELLENPQHELSKITTFGEMGYFGESCTVESCSVCATVTLNATVGAMFVDYGYSATEAAINGVYSMSQFYGINREAIEQYRALSPDFEFGFVVAANADPFGAVAEGTLASDKIFVTEEKFFQYDYASVSIGGIAGENVSKAITFCMFVKDGEKISYLDGGKTASAVAMKSYNDVLAIVNTNENGGEN